VVSTLEAAMRKGRNDQLPAEVVDLLRDDPGLLAVADAIKTIGDEGDVRQRRRTAPIATSMGAVVAVAVAVLLIAYRAPTPPRQNLISKAASAVAGGDIIHVRMSYRSASDQRVRVAGEFNVDTGRGQTTLHLGGTSDLITPKIASLPELVRRFVVNYRRKLEAKEAIIALRTQSAVWIRLTIAGVHYQVAIDPKSYRPILVRIVPAGSHATVTLDVEQYEVS
jgi:hypothetical protein